MSLSSLREWILLLAGLGTLVLGVVAAPPNPTLMGVGTTLLLVTPVVKGKP